MYSFGIPPTHAQMFVTGSFAGAAKARALKRVMKAPTRINIANFILNNEKIAQARTVEEWYEEGDQKREET